MKFQIYVSIIHFQVISVLLKNKFKHGLSDQKAGSSTIDGLLEVFSGEHGNLTIFF